MRLLEVAIAASYSFRVAGSSRHRLCNSRTWGQSMTLRALGTFGFALNVLAAVSGSPARALPVMVELTIDDLAAKKKSTVTDQQTKRNGKPENQAIGKPSRQRPEGCQCRY